MRQQSVRAANEVEGDKKQKAESSSYTKPATVRQKQKRLRTILPKVTLIASTGLEHFIFF